MLGKRGNSAARGLPKYSDHDFLARGLQHFHALVPLSRHHPFPNLQTGILCFLIPSAPRDGGSRGRGCPERLPHVSCSASPTRGARAQEPGEPSKL